jgi:hypothetical protein
MAGKIKVDSAYLMAPESEAMPKVRLLPLTGGGDGGAEETGNVTTEPAVPVAKPKAAATSMAADRIKRPGKALKFPEPAPTVGAGRQKR